MRIVYETNQDLNHLSYLRLFVKKDKLAEKSIFKTPREKVVLTKKNKSNTLF